MTCVVMIYSSFGPNVTQCQEITYVRSRMGMHVNQGESQWHVSAVEQTFRMHQYVLNVFVVYPFLIACLSPQFLFSCVRAVQVCNM